MQTLSPWRKSTYSGNGGQDCVETADAAGAILVRDTTDRSGTVLEVSASAWQAFTATLR
jgi:hypothetical protein